MTVAVEPIMVRPAPLEGRFQIVHGERRYRASKLAGLKEVSAPSTAAVWLPARIVGAKVNRSP
jgi:hypothetical protein